MFVKVRVAEVQRWRKVASDVVRAPPQHVSDTRKTGAPMVEALVSVIIGFVLMIVMMLCFLTATLVLLAIVSWIVDGVVRLRVVRRDDRVLSG